MSFQRFSKYVFELLQSGVIKCQNYFLDKRGKLNVHKTFRGYPTRLLDILRTFNLRSVFRGNSLCCRNTLKQPENDWVYVMYKVK